MERDMTPHGHDKDHWCGDCFNFKEVDLRSEGLGKGFIISNMTPKPLMITAKVDGKNIEVKNAGAKPLEIIKTLDLRKPQFEKTAQWGHFGNNFLWDR